MVLLQTDVDRFLAGQGGLQPSPATDQALVQALNAGFANPDALALPIAHYLADKWPRALKGTAARGERQLIEVLRDPVLLALLRATPALTPSLEILLARFRHGALKAALARKDQRPFIATLFALAFRGAHSGYALTLPLIDRHAAEREDEPKLVAALEQQVREGGLHGHEYGAAIAVLACYREPNETDLRRGIAAGDPVALHLQEHVATPRAEQRSIARALTPRTPIRPENRTLAEQYEAHPYPAWINLPSQGVDLPTGVAEALSIAGYEQVQSVLVAGCGTGMHALLAAHSWPSADVLAIDISRTSLSYAIHKTRQMAGRLHFALADLCEIGRVGRQFDAIEAMGVLHHLADPLAGLRALRSVLRPGGVIGLALYSATARAPLAHVRRQYGQDARSDDEVRRFRAWALAELDLPSLLYSSDFYSIGGCRDTIFNVRERCYSLPEVKEMLDSVGLRLLAIQPPPPAQELLASLPLPDDVAGWDAAERRHPQLFLSMYEVWAQAADPPGAT